jgi:MFS family permease
MNSSASGDLQPENQNGKFFYGWVLVGLGFVVQFVVMGTMIQSFPVFLLPLAEEFGTSRAEAALPTVAIMGAGLIFSPMIGMAVTRFPIRNVMLFGATVMIAGFYLLSQATAFWQIVLIYGIAGPTAMSALGAISCNSLMVNWFERKRAMALGIAMMGMSISGAVLIPLSTWGLEHWGWRGVYEAFALSGLALMPPIAWLVVTRPSEMGLAQDGDAIPAIQEGPGLAAPSPLLSVRALLFSPILWGVAAACGLGFFGGVAVMNHGMAFAVDRGIAPMRAAGLLSAISVGAALGKLVFGGLSDKVGEKGALGAALAVEFVALIGLWGAEAYTTLLGAAGAFGLGMGGISPLQAALLARGFGARDFGRAMGLLGPVTIPFTIGGPPLAGWIFDTQGSYDLALVIFMVTTAIAGVICWRLPLTESPSKEPEASGSPTQAT